MRHKNRAPFGGLIIMGVAVIALIVNEIVRWFE